MSLSKDMGDKHEKDLQISLGGRRTKSSGNQWNDKADGRHSRYQERQAFAWDGKSTMAKSVSISRAMLQKIKEDATPEDPLIGIRFYDPDSGTKRLKVDEDWVLVPLWVFADMLRSVNDETEHCCCGGCWA